MNRQVVIRVLVKFRILDRVGIFFLRRISFVAECFTEPPRFSRREFSPAFFLIANFFAGWARVISSFVQGGFHFSADIGFSRRKIFHQVSPHRGGEIKFSVGWVCFFFVTNFFSSQNFSSGGFGFFIVQFSLSPNLILFRVPVVAVSGGFHRREFFIV